MINNQKGYALLITLILLLLVSVLGIAMMTTNLTAATQNKTRESSVQSEDLAVKGAEFFSMSLQSELEESILKNTRLTVPEYTEKLRLILQKKDYQCLRGNVEIPTDISDPTNVCIEKIYIEGNQNPTDSQLAESLKWIVVLRSTSVVDGQTKIVRQHIEYGTENVPDQLRYALSTNGKGDLFLFGAVEVIGDLKTSRNLYISNHAHYVASETKFIQTTPIKLRSNIGNAKVILPTDSTTGIRYSTYNPSSLSSTKKLDFSKGKWETNHYTTNLLDTQKALSDAKKYFTQAENLTFERRDTQDDKIKIIEEINKCSNNILCKSNSLNDIKITPSMVKTDLDDYKSNKQKQFYISSRSSTSPALSISGFTSNTLDLKGIYYLNGGLTITNTQLQADSIFFVNGDVTIQNSEFLKQENEQLYIFATGNISISNISEYSDTPSLIKGFFYSDNDVSLYGVGSNIYIDGGLSGKNINLSALRGNTLKVTKTRRECFFIYFCTDVSYQELEAEPNQQFINPTTGLPKQSRLIVNYDPQLITDFEKFERPVSNELLPLLNQPVIIKTEIVNASP